MANVSEPSIGADTEVHGASINRDDATLAMDMVVGDVVDLQISPVQVFQNDDINLMFCRENIFSLNQYFYELFVTIENALLLVSVFHRM